MAPATIHGKIIDMKRMRNTPNGNPRWEVTILASDGVRYLVRSAPDSSLAGRLDNTEFRTTDHTFSVNKDGQLGLIV